MERVLRPNGAIKTVYVGILEPGTFIGKNEGRKRLEDAGVNFEILEGMHNRVMEVSMAGHEN